MNENVINVVQKAVDNTFLMIESNNYIRGKEYSFYDFLNYTPHNYVLGVLNGEEESAERDFFNAVQTHITHYKVRFSQKSGKYSSLYIII